VEESKLYRFKIFILIDEQAETRKYELPHSSESFSSGPKDCRASVSIYIYLYICLMSIYLSQLFKVRLDRALRNLI